MMVIRYVADNKYLTADLLTYPFRHESAREKKYIVLF